MNKCSDGYLNCKPYKASLAFYVKDTDKTATNLKVNQLELDTFVVDNDAEEYDLDNAEEVMVDVYKDHAFHIIQANQVNHVPGSIVTSDKAVAENNKEEIKKESQKNKRAYLKSLSIECYSLDFKSDRYSYSLIVPNDVNSIKVYAVPLLEDSVVEVVGADDLKKFSNQVKISVSLKDKTKSTYFKVKKEGLSQKTYQNSYNKLNKIFMIAGGVVLGIILFSIIMSIQNKRKMKKLGY